MAKRPPERNLVAIADIDICRDCFDAAHFDKRDVGEDRWQELEQAREAIAKQEGEIIVRRSDEDNPYFSNAPCMCCDSPLAEDRWKADVWQWQEKESS